MLESLSTIPFLLLNSILFGFFTKYADLLNEHGLKLFKNADIIFGFITLLIMMLFQTSYGIVIVSYLFNSLAYQIVKEWGKKNLKNY